MHRLPCQRQLPQPQHQCFGLAVKIEEKDEEARVAACQIALAAQAVAANAATQAIATEGATNAQRSAPPWTSGAGAPTIGTDMIDFKGTDRIKSFTGVSALYMAWRERAQEHMCRGKPKLEGLLRRVEKSASSIDEAAELSCELHGIGIDASQASSEIYSLLAYVIGDELRAKKIAAGAQRGLELWRSLYNEYERNSAVVQLARLSRYLQPERAKNIESLSTALDKWEVLGQKKHEGGMDLDLIPALTSMLPPGSSEEPEVVDTDWPNESECWNCGKTGHRSSDCWAAAGSSPDAPKGKGKGNGKGNINLLVEGDEEEQENWHISLLTSKPKPPGISEPAARTAACHVDESLQQERPLMSVEDLTWEGKRWQQLEFAVDSGAVATVIPPHAVQGMSTVPSAGSKAGHCYHTADGGEIPNLGEVVLLGRTDDLQGCAVTAQVADIVMPLLSVVCVSEQGSTFHFGARAGYIKHVASGRVTRLTKRGKFYHLKMWVELPGEAEEEEEPLLAPLGPDGQHLPDVQTDEDEEATAEDAEEAAAARVLKDPGQPTEQEVEEHCTVPSVSLDYCFLRDGDEELLTEVVVRDKITGATFGSALAKKGSADEDAVEQTAEFIRRLGHPKLTIKSDQEPPVTDFSRAVGLRLSCQVIPELSPVGESQSNVVAQAAVQIVEDVLRTLKLGVERRVSAKIPCARPTMEWLVSHAADVTTKYLRSQDGRTAYERLKGKPCREDVVEFGECDGAVRHCRAVQRLPRDSCWSKDRLEAVRGTPRCMNPREDQQGVPLVLRPRPAAGVEGDEAVMARAMREAVPRSFRIAKADLARWGYTAGCFVVQAPCAASAWKVSSARHEELAADAGMKEPDTMNHDDMASMVGVRLQLGMSKYEVHEAISEIYSPPRVTAAATQHEWLGLKAGVAYDLQVNSVTGESWDFSLASHRAKCRREIAEQKPQLMVSSPPNVAMSYRKMDPDDVRRRRAEGLVLLAFAAEICATQVKGGRYFLHERPATANSWMQQPMTKLLAMRGESTTVANMYAFGMTSVGPDGKEELVLKATRWASNAPCLLKWLGVRCSNGGGMAERCDQLREDGGKLEEKMIAALCEEETQGEWMTYDGEFVDDISGEAIPKVLVVAGRKLEMEFFHKEAVYTKRPISECWQQTGKARIRTKWIDRNKGEKSNPDIRCRLVACQYNLYKDAELFAATPPLEALRFLISAAATSRPRTGHRKASQARRAGQRKLLLIDARRAYFNAVSATLTYVELPEEDAEPGMCGMLNKCMYGTRDAARRREETYTQHLLDLGFKQGRASPCCFTHSTRDLHCVVHGDDFTFLGDDIDLDWIQSAVALKFEIKVRGRLGDGPEDVQEMLASSTVWCSEKYRSPEAWSQPLNAAGISAYRSITARIKYLAEVKHIARYLVGKPRLVYEYRFQEHADLDTYVDSDYAGRAVWVITSGTHSIGLQSIAADLSAEVENEKTLRADSSAAKGICQRRGIGKIRHLAVSTLWIQDRSRSGDIRLCKTAGALNPSDILTKHVEGHRVGEHLSTMKTRPGTDRAKGAPLSTKVLRRRWRKTEPWGCEAEKCGTEVMLAGTGPPSRDYDYCFIRTWTYQTLLCLSQAGLGAWWGSGHLNICSALLPGHQQTNQRAELAAVIHVLQHEPRALHFKSDSALVVNGCLQHRVTWNALGWRHMNKVDLWRELRSPMESRVGHVVVSKVKGHASERDVRSGRAKREDNVGNDAADLLAIEGAKSLCASFGCCCTEAVGCSDRGEARDEGFDGDYVGKTHLLSRYMKDTLPKAPAATIGVEFATRTVRLPSGGANVKAQIWDTAGQERYRAITRAHYRRAAGAVMVYDVTKQTTFRNCSTWVTEVREGASPDAVIFLVGNKVDLVEQDPSSRQVYHDVAAEFARQHGLMFMEASAVTSLNVNEVFEKLLEEVYAKAPKTSRVLGNPESSNDGRGAFDSHSA
ncbi:unnamed protein product, partial [Polarella glacialis]